MKSARGGYEQAMIIRTRQGEGMEGWGFFLQERPCQMTCHRSSENKRGQRDDGKIKGKI